MPTLSVVVCTYDRAGPLGRCLDALLTPGQRFLEIIVVDDGSSDDTAAVVAARASLGAPVHYVFQANAGLSAARNAGAARASGDVLAFVDDDVVVEPGWSEQILSAFRARPEAAGIGGRVLLRFDRPAPGWLRPCLHGWLSEIDLGPIPRWLEPPQYPQGAAMAVAAKVLAEVGGFDERLGRRRGSLISNDEKELFVRVRRVGGRLLWWPSAVVHHQVPPERLTRSWFLRRAFAQGDSDERMESRERRSAASAMLGATASALWSGPVLVRALLRGDGGMPAGTWLAYQAGRLSRITRLVGGARHQATARH